MYLELLELGQVNFTVVSGAGLWHNPLHQQGPEKTFGILMMEHPRISSIPVARSKGSRCL
jgi:hypothetical protein